MYSGIVFDYLAMATIRLTVLNSIKESDGRLPILVCISQKVKGLTSKLNFLSTILRNSTTEKSFIVKMLIR